jgi:hypothetical protein
MRATAGVTTRRRRSRARMASCCRSGSGTPARSRSP